MAAGSRQMLQVRSREYRAAVSGDPAAMWEPDNDKAGEVSSGAYVADLQNLTVAFNGRTCATLATMASFELCPRFPPADTRH